MTDVEQLRQWAQLAGIHAETVRDRADLVGLFQHFRPNGDGMDAIFEGLVLGDELKERVRQCFSATAMNAHAKDAYFIPQPQPCHRSEAISMLRAHFADLKRIASEMGDQELVDILSAVPLRQVAPAQVDEIVPSDDCPGVWIFDLVANFTTTLTPVDTPLLLLKDAIYSMANDKLLQLYVMWPLYKESSERNDPFRSYFLLWAKGIRYTIPSSDGCLFCT